MTLLNKMKIVAVIIVLIVIAFFGVKNVQAQVHVSNKSYDIMLSSLLAHSVNETSVDSIKDQILLDAREINEFEVSHIQGAQWIGYDDFDLSRVADLDKDSKIVVYCSVGYRSEKISEQLVNAGFTNVQNLYGGIFEWVNTGRDVVDPNGEHTKDVHAYSKSWGVWLKKGKKVYN
jgi:rhodanese-related sulfurtransferase